MFKVGQKYRINKGYPTGTHLKLMDGTPMEQEGNIFTATAIDNEGNAWSEEVLYKGQHPFPPTEGSGVSEVSGWCVGMVNYLRIGIVEEVNE